MLNGFIRYAYPDDLLPTKGSRCKRKQVTVTVDSEHPKQVPSATGLWQLGTQRNYINIYIHSPNHYEYINIYI